MIKKFKFSYKNNKKKEKMLVVIGKRNYYGGPATFSSLLQRHCDEEKISLKFVSDFKECIALTLECRGSALVINGTSHLLLQLIFFLSSWKVTTRIDGYKYSHYSSVFSRPGILSRVRKFLTILNILMSNQIIFQSEYVKKCWSQSVISPIFKNKTRFVIINPVELPENHLPRRGEKIICVEGVTGNGYSRELLKSFSKHRQIEVLGECAYKNHVLGVTYRGRVSRAEVDEYLNRDWFAFLVLEAFPACPNAVLEAVAHGIPVVGMDNGALAEILGSTDTLIPNACVEGKESDFQELSETEVKKKLDFLMNNWSSISEFLIERSKSFERKKILKEYLELLFS